MSADLGAAAAVLRSHAAHKEASSASSAPVRWLTGAYSPSHSQSPDCLFIAAAAATCCRGSRCVLTSPQALATTYD